MHFPYSKFLFCFISFMQSSSKNLQREKGHVSMEARYCEEKAWKKSQSLKEKKSSLTHSFFLLIVAFGFRSHSDEQRRNQSERV